jgi:cytochrome b561
MRAQQYDGVARLMHWVLGPALIAQIALGWWMHAVAKEASRPWVELHVSLGITLGILVALRVLWRLTHPAPPLPRMPAWQRLAAFLSHAGLYALMLLVPLTGYLGATFHKQAPLLFGLPLPHWPWPAVRNALWGLHTTLAWAFAGLIAVHIAAALWHALRSAFGASGYRWRV